MLEGLERVNWDRLTHAYGRAGNVPDLIRGLASPDDSVREQAGYGLASTIFHQGTRYRASAPAAPFLFEVLEAPETRGIVPLINLLVMLAVGYPENHLPFGFDPNQAFGLAAELARQKDLTAVRDADPDQDEDFDPALDALWARDAYEAVLERIEAFRRLTRHDDPTIRQAAVRALAWFPEAAEASAALVRDALRSEQDPVGTANAILTLGLLDGYLRNEQDLGWLNTRLREEWPYTVRVAASLSLAVLLRNALPAQGLDVLLGVLQDTRKAEDEGAAISWHGRGLVAQVSDAIVAIKPVPTEAVVSVLTQSVEAVEWPTVAQVMYALLSLVFPEPKPVTWERDPNPPHGVRAVYLDPVSLTKVQARAVQAIGRNPFWQRTPFVAGDSQDVLYAFGLPFTPEPYAQFVQATVS